MDKEMEDLNNSLPLILVSQKELDVLQAKIGEAIALLDVAICPQCQDKSGAYYDDHGQIYQCQWCHEVNELKRGK